MLTDPLLDRIGRLTVSFPMIRVRRVLRRCRQPRGAGSGAPSNEMRSPQLLSCRPMLAVPSQSSGRPFITPVAYAALAGILKGNYMVAVGMGTCDLVLPRLLPDLSPPLGPGIE